MSEQEKPAISNVHIIEGGNSSWFSKLRDRLPFNPSLPHLIIFIFIIVILVELGLGIKNLATPTQGLSVHHPVTNGNITLNSDKASYEVGEKILVNIKVSTGGHSTDGTDLVLSYDPASLELNPNSFFTKGSIYPDYPFVHIENNIVSISAISSTSGGTFNGVGNFGTLEFTAKKSGETSITLDANKDSTSDTNITETGTAVDILGEVKNLELSIGTSPKEVETPRACANYTQLCFDDKGNQGTQECSKGSIQANKCSFDPLLTESCSSCKVD